MSRSRRPRRGLPEAAPGVGLQAPATRAAPAPVRRLPGRRRRADAHLRAGHRLGAATPGCATRSSGRTGSARSAGSPATLRPSTPPPRCRQPASSAARQRRPVPYLCSEADIRRLLQAARRCSRRCGRPPTRRSSGCSPSRGCASARPSVWTDDDVDLGDGVITIEQAKFGRARLVPLHPSTTDALRAYSARRDQLCPTPVSATFFVSSLGTALLANPVRRDVPRNSPPTSACARRRSGHVSMI